MVKRTYLDHAATTPVSLEVVEAMQPYFTGLFGNASSMHSFGREAHDALEDARKNVADLIGARKEEVFFTSGGTESDNHAIKGIALKHWKDLRKTKGPHIITSKIEHPAVIEPCRFLESLGFEVKYLSVDEYGLIDLEDLENSITQGTFLITIMHANNEIGTIQPIEEIGKIAAEKDVIFHTDAVQSVGKISLDVKKVGVRMLSISSHKIYGPKGVGALYIEDGISLEPMIHGGGHEKGLRSGTENIAGIVGFGKAAEIARKRLDYDFTYLTGLRDKLIKNVLDNIEESYLNGHPTKRLPNNAHFRFSAVDGEALVLSLDEKGIAASTGSACSSKKLEPSHVLTAIGLNELESRGSLRLTLGRGNVEEEIDYTVESLIEVVGILREMSPLWRKPNHPYEFSTSRRET